MEVDDEAEWEDVEEVYIIQGRELTKKELEGYMEAVVRNNLMIDVWWANKIGREKKKLQRGNTNLYLTGSRRCSYLGRVDKATKL